MIAEGIFRIAYTGTNGSGLGIVVLHKGTVVGADTGGGSYDGSYTESASPQTVDLVVTLTMPAGVAPVMTGIPIARAMSLLIRASLPLDSEKPTLVQTALGPVNVLFKKIRDFP
jgi:hypothetical protein